MKIKVNKELIIDGLQKVQSVINPRNALPVLSNVLIRAADGHLELTATDMNLTVRATVPAEVTEPGATTLPAKRIFGVFRELSVDEAEMEVNDDNIAFIHAASSYFRIHGIPEADYPILPEMEDAKSYSLDQAAFRNMLKLTAYAASPTPTASCSTACCSASRPASSASWPPTAAASPLSSMKSNFLPTPNWT